MTDPQDEIVEVGPSRLAPLWKMQDEIVQDVYELPRTHYNATGTSSARWHRMGLAVQIKDEFPDLKFATSDIYTMLVDNSDDAAQVNGRLELLRNILSLFLDSRETTIEEDRALCRDENHYIERTRLCDKLYDLFPERRLSERSLYRLLTRCNDDIEQVKSCIVHILAVQDLLSNLHMRYRYFLGLLSDSDHDLEGVKHRFLNGDLVSSLNSQNSGPETQIESLPIHEGDNHVQTKHPWWTNPSRDGQRSPDVAAEGSSRSAQVPEVAQEYVGDLPSIEEAQREMQRLGWCWHQIDYVSRISGIKGLYDLAAIDKRVHRPQDHSPCLSQSHCIAHNAPPDARYESLHAPSCSVDGCSMVEVPEDELLHIVRTGGVPLISIHEDSLGVMSLQVHRRGFSSTYATISHVWADGLGNPMSNALPSCQIKHLQSMLNNFADDEYWATYLEVVGSVPRSQVTLMNIMRMDLWRVLDRVIFRQARKRLLWMDTLCIPVRPEHADLRWQCIDAMSSIYAGSTLVYVLDAELMSSKRPPEPTRLISTSVWMCRSWTLQEALLPKACVFQFSDRPFKLLKFGNDRTVIRNQYLPLGGPLEQIGRFEENGTDLDVFIATWNALAGRSSTKADDLYVVLASCLGLKLRQLRKFTTAAEKLEHIILSQEVLPLSLLTNPGPRQRAGLNKWLPTEVSHHLMTTGSTFRVPSTSVSNYSDQGMRMELALDDETTVLVCESIPMAREYNLHAGLQHYHIRDMVISEDDEARARLHCTSLCIVADGPLDAQNRRHGVCFHVESVERVGHERGGKDCYRMTYAWPVLVTTKSCEDLLSRSASESYAAYIVDTTCSFWVNFAPTPGFKPLKRQPAERRQYRMYYGFAALLIFALPFLGWPVLLDLILGIDGVPIWTGLVITLIMASVGSFLAIVASSAALHFRDYVFLYQSYDDNTVADKVGRLIKTIAMAPLQVAQIGLGHLRQRFRRQQNYESADRTEA